MNIYGRNPLTALIRAVQRRRTGWTTQPEASGLAWLLAGLPRSLRKVLRRVGLTIPIPVWRDGKTFREFDFLVEVQEATGGQLLYLDGGSDAGAAKLWARILTVPAVPFPMADRSREAARVLDGLWEECGQSPIQLRVGRASSLDFYTYLITREADLKLAVDCLRVYGVIDDIGAIWVRRMPPFMMKRLTTLASEAGRGHRS